MSQINTFMDRRQKKKDWVIYAISAISLIGWMLAFLSFTFLDKAKPMEENIFTRLLNVQVVRYWDSGLLYASFILMALSLFSCLVGFVFNIRRHRRKTDRYNRTILALGLLSSIFMAIFLWKFWRLLF